MSLQALIQKMDNILSEAEGSQAVEIFTVNHIDKGKLGSVNRYTKLNINGKTIHTYRIVLGGKEDPHFNYYEEKDAIASLLNYISRSGGYIYGSSTEYPQKIYKPDPEFPWRPDKFDY